MPVINHTDVDLSIYQMVRNRLTFLADTPENELLISQFTLEVMWELEKCFQVGQLPDVAYDPDLVGHEENYSVVQQSIIADVVATYILFMEGASHLGATSSGGSQTVGTFLKRAKAGSAEVEYDAFEKTSFAGTTTFSIDALASRYMKSAIRRAAAGGCYFDICDDCTIKWIEYDMMTMPFVAAGASTCCGCC